MIRGLGFCVVLGLAACGRFGFDPFGVGPGDDGPGDGGPGDGGPIDVPADACAFGAWSAPQVVTALNSTVGEFGGQITADGLAYYFARGGVGVPEIYVSRRASRTATFGTPQPIASLQSGAGDSGPSLRDDELEMYFDSFRTGAICIHRATRANTAAAWDTPTPVTAICSSGDVLGPYLTPDGLRLYYNTNELSQRGKLMVATRATRTDAFGAGAAVFGTSGTGRRGFPALSADELTIYFEYDNGGQSTIREATRATRADAFSGEQPLSVTPNSSDTDPSITADGRELYFSSSPAGNAEVVVTTRSCL